MDYLTKISKSKDFDKKYELTYFSSLTTEIREESKEDGKYKIFVR